MLTSAAADDGGPTDPTPPSPLTQHIVDYSAEATCMHSVTHYDLCDCSPPTLDKHVFSPVRVKRHKVNTMAKTIRKLRFITRSSSVPPAPPSPELPADPDQDPIHTK